MKLHHRIDQPQPTGLRTLSGRNHWNADTERCERCDSRYCHTVCMAGHPDYFYVTGRGWVTRTMAVAQAATWQHNGQEWGPHHPTRRIEAVCADRRCPVCRPNHRGQVSKCPPIDLTRTSLKEAL